MSNEEPPKPVKIRGGKRQQRQYRSLQTKLSEGELTREQLAAQPSKSLYALGLAAHPETGLWIGEPSPSAPAPRVPPPPPPPPAAASRPDRVEAALARRRAADEQKKAKEEADQKAKEEADQKAKEKADQKAKEEAERAAAELQLEEDEDEEEEKARQVAPAPPTPRKAKGSIVVSLKPFLAPAPASPDEASSPVPPHRARIAVDFHGVLDVDLQPSGRVPLSTVQAFRQLIAQGFCPWICSYIGQGGPKSEERRGECKRIVGDLAGQLGLAFPVDRISHQGLYLLIVPQKLWCSKHRGGKAVALRHLQTGILVDDRREVCNEAEDYGILPYQVLTGKRPREKDIYKVSQDSFECGPLEHLFSESIGGAVREILADDTSVFKGKCVLDWKLEAVASHKVW